MCPVPEWFVVYSILGKCVLMGCVQRHMQKWPPTAFIHVATFMVQRPVNTICTDAALLNTRVGSVAATGGCFSLTRNEVAACSVQWLVAGKGSGMTG